MASVDLFLPRLVHLREIHADFVNVSTGLFSRLEAYLDFVIISCRIWLQRLGWSY